MFNKKTVRDIDINNKRVLVRVDFNVPLSQGRVEDDTRIRAALPTINYLRRHQAKVILVTHLGRPKGRIDDRLRLDAVAERLSEMLDSPVIKLDKTVTDEVTAAVSRMLPGDVILLENVRFNPGELTNDPVFARKLADLADVFVNDAFGTSHRAHASVVGVANYLPAVSGFLLEAEITHLTKIIQAPRRPFLAILGGNKISDKIGVIERFLDNVDSILTGGGMCFTFLKAKGLSIGKSLVEIEQLETAKNILKKAEEKGVSFYIPSDIIVAEEISGETESKAVTVDKIPDGWMGLDIGPRTIDVYRQVITRAKTIFWNGPMGVFEIKNFAQGTIQISEAIAKQTQRGALSIVGGGDSDAALKKFGLEDEVSFVSTGGGASLRVLEGLALPGMEALADKF
ncbi:MAG TPA: phosphoglycerate kinase [Actinobacteria bacterium]|nr:phosphoglycerate kinase [Actinomycetes bacterium]HEX21459.1 phosphoglycerate kinase [Actinomycetota bacterium]